MNCTWFECSNEAVREQRDEQGKVWANLCEDHDRQLTDSLCRGQAAQILSGWVKAQGGAKKAAKRMIEQ